MIKDLRKEQNELVRKEHEELVKLIKLRTKRGDKIVDIACDLGLAESTILALSKEK